AGELVALDEALTNLATVDPRKSRLVELRFFGGLNIDETAEVMELSPTTVQREWRAAKAWLQRFIKGENPPENLSLTWSDFLQILAIRDRDYLHRSSRRQMIDIDRYRRIDEIFQAALELEPRDRAPYISQACSGDAALLKEVEDLLASDGQQWELIGT